MTQYGLRLSTKEFKSVSWGEFRALLSGISPDTPLGRIVSIRSETDKGVIKHFSPEQKRIYNDWQKRSAKQMEDNPDRYAQEMRDLERIFAGMCGAAGSAKGR